jgi:HSP20 family protein
MAKQEQQEQRTGGRDLEQQGSSGAMTRAGFPAGMLIPPGDFFRLNPFSMMRRMSEEMNRLMGEFGMSRSDNATAVWAPAIEISQSEGKYMVRAELPGIKPEDVKIETTDEAVILQGERKVETHENKGGMQVTERQYGRFYRAIPLPEGAKVEEAKAKFENGMIEVTVPVPAQKEKRRQVPIEAPKAA